MSEARGTRWLDADQQASWRAFAVGVTLLLDRLDEDLQRAYDLSLTEYEILVRLSERPERSMRMAQLADALAHSRSRVTHTVARMQNADLVRRSTSPEDGRGIVCTLTERGYALLVEAAHVPRRPRRARGLRRRRPGDERRHRPADRVSPRGGHPPLSDSLSGHSAGQSRVSRG
jgi:DNA-binding MarR family transcriptional regulator